MGAASFVHIEEGFSIREVFERLGSEAIRCHGSDPYNGTISTCSLGRCARSYPEWSKALEDQVVNDLNNRMNSWHKWSADYVDLGVCGYMVVTVKKTNAAYTAKYKQKFVVCDRFGIKSYGAFDTKPLADTAACTLALQKPDGDFCVRKTMVRLEGNDEVAFFRVEKKRVDKKPKVTSGPNVRVYPIHKYVLYGFAAC